MARGALLEVFTYRSGAPLVDLFGGDGGESDIIAEKEKSTVPSLLAIFFSPLPLRIRTPSRDLSLISPNRAVSRYRRAARHCW